jgi:hypothetical protein
MRACTARHGAPALRGVDQPQRRLRRRRGELPRIRPAQLPATPRAAARTGRSRRRPAPPCSCAGRIRGSSPRRRRSQKVYAFKATRMERYIVGCYAAEDNAHFRAHRDNTGDRVVPAPLVAVVGDSDGAAVDLAHEAGFLAAMHPDGALHRRLLRRRGQRAFPRPSRQHHARHGAPALRGVDQAGTRSGARA